MIHFESFGFAAPPCVAARWFVQCCEMCGILAVDKYDIVYPPDRSFLGFRLSIVRHPLSWLRAYWHHSELHPERVHVPEVDIFYDLRDKAGGRFLRFVDLYLQENSGGVGRMFDAYRSDSIIRCEDFPWCVIEFLQSLGVRDTRFVERMKPVDCCDMLRDRDLVRAVREAERDFCDRAEYF